jgi:hypothetical protein
MQGNTSYAGSQALEATSEEEHLAKMKKVTDAWQQLSPLIQSIADGATVTNDVINQVESKAGNVETEMTGAADLYSATTVTTTKIPVNILVPLPFTGRWTPGETMRTATMVATDIINAQQDVLPGYEIKIEFMDDRCDKEHAMRSVLAKFASTDSWVALAGMACSRVCESLAVISASMWIPTVSMDCSSDSLSDTLQYPDFTRLGVRTTSARDVIIEWGKMFQWTHVAILSGDPTLYQAEAAVYQTAFTNAGLGNSYTSTIETSWEDIVSVMRRLKMAKRRVVMLMGTESLFRKVVCASAAAESTKGITWIWVGITQESWWTMDDASVMALSPSCTGANITDLLQGALSITGLGVPEKEDSDKPLDCFKGYSSKSLITLINRSLAEGYPKQGNNVVSAPHVDLMGAAADGLCVVAKAVKKMLDMGHSIAALRSPQQNIYKQAINVIKTQTQFRGVSGTVQFTGNDKLGRLGLWQVQGSYRKAVGTVGVDASIHTGYTFGLQNSSWRADDDSENDADVQWRTGLITAGRQRMLIQKMSLELLKVSLNHNTAKTLLMDAITSFETDQKNLKDGSTDGFIVPAPTQDVATALLATQKLWEQFKNFLLNALALPRIDTSTVASLNTQINPMVDSANVIATRYVDAANGAQAKFSGLQVDTASRQAMLMLEITVQSVMLYLGIDKTATLARIEATKTLFDQALAGMLEGLDFVGLSATVNKCILQHMRSFTFSWKQFTNILDQISFNRAASKNDVDTMFAQIPTLLNETEKATQLYANPPKTCPVTVPDDQWKAVLDYCTEHVMMALKSCRLFLQAAKGVNTLDSRVLFSNADSSVRETLSYMREGSQTLGIPAPVTQVVSIQYGSMWNTWTELGNLFARTINSVSSDDTRLLAQAEIGGKNYYEAARVAIDNTVAECERTTTSLQCVTLRVAGSQRIFVQKAAFEAVLIGLEQNMNENRNALNQTIQDFERSHFDLIHGKAPSIPRTTRVCTLIEMKKVDDLWRPFAVKMMEVYYGDDTFAHALKDTTMSGQGDRIVDLLLIVWGMTWDAGVDPMFAQITTAMNTYANGCLANATYSATNAELESALRHVGIIRGLVFKLSDLFLLIAKGVDPQVNQAKLHNAVAQFDDLLPKIISGYTPMNLPVPMEQHILNHIIYVAGNWTSFKKLLMEPVKSFTVYGDTKWVRARDDQVELLVQESSRFMEKVESAMVVYLDAVWAANGTVPGGRSNLASGLIMQVQHMLRKAVLVSVGHSAGWMRSTLQTAISTYKASQQTLIDGNAVTGKTAIKKTDEQEHLQQMQTVSSLWTSLEPKLNTMAIGTVEPSITEMSDIATAAEALDASLIKALGLFYETTVTTTKTPVDILVPLPMSGMFDPGPTMKIAAWIAKDLINQEQVLLPGYEIKIKFTDTSCDKEISVRDVLQEFAGSKAWVALGGLACSSVCESLAVISASLRMPSVAMDCNSGALSSTTLFPDFVRLGVRLNLAPKVVRTWGKLFSWTTMPIIAGNPDFYKTQGESIVNDLMIAMEGLPAISSSLSTVLEANVEGIQSIAAELVKAKNRRVMILGNENFHRKVICAMHLAGARAGMVIVSVGALKKDWWKVDDPDVAANMSSLCTGSLVTSLYADGLSITSISAPSNKTNTSNVSVSNSSKDLPCFQGHTYQSLMNVINQSLYSGYPTNSSNNAVPAPHEQLMGAGAEGICMIVKMVRHMLDEGHDISSLRSPQDAVYKKAIEFLRQGGITGISGKIDFNGNDRIGRLGLFQVQSGKQVAVGTVEQDGAVHTSWKLGLRNSSWTGNLPEAEEEPFPYAAVVVPLAIALVCFPCIAAWFAVRRQERNMLRGIQGQGFFDRMSGAWSGRTGSGQTNNQMHSPTNGGNQKGNGHNGKANGHNGNVYGNEDLKDLTPF